DNLPVVPWKKAIVVDGDTENGKRRFFSLDREAWTAKYEPAFADRPLPALEPEKLDGTEGAKIFETAWKAVDEEYAMFGIKPRVDWEALKKLYAPLSEQARTSYEAAGVVNLLLASLEDLHVYVKHGEEFLWGFSRWRPLNASWKATQAL